MNEKPDNKQITCHQCGRCCSLFFINLSKKEYNQNKYVTIFEDVEGGKLDYNEAKKSGANLIKTKENGACYYLKNNKCSIHKARPAVCRSFFCQGDEKKYKKMREIIEKDIAA